MKKIILILFFILFTLGASAQCNKPYKAFSAFAKDTTAFLRYNFKERTDCYKGKTVAQVLTDLQLTPKSYVPIPSTYKNKYSGIYVYVDNSYSAQRIENPKMKTQYIYIYWPELMDYTDLLKLIRKYDDDVWVQEHYNFFKNNIVGEVSTK
ncbi:MULTISPECIES: hypothetical protein [unclassified Dysgonomonas]|uniref:hypothetical protein n=1 Tax=unclassified Dysgonomonas TaxID=2630389 RepID=UPI0024737AAC|nr:MULTISPECIES: hypothetical protein [unclassified Dysgonomonas]